MNVFKSLLVVLLFGCFACSKEQSIVNEEKLDTIPGPYRIEGNTITYQHSPVYYKGVNAMQSFGLTDADLMDQWQIQVVREFIGNLREQPISGSALLGSDNRWYHPLQHIVDNNRAHNKITILCPFGWVDTDGEQTLFTGLHPASQSFYAAYLQKMKLIASHFKDQPDVWIEVWNEPYHWNNDNNYSHTLWLTDMTEMILNLREVEGFTNIIVVPGNEQGQSEDVILSKGKQLLQNNYNILFDIHAYEKWLVNTTKDEIVSRIQEINRQDFAIVFGEAGVHNVSDIMPVDHFLEAVEQTHISTLAWLWNQNSSDPNALLTDNGEPNASATNNYWGSSYQAFLLE